MKKTILILTLLIGGFAYADNHEGMKEGKFTEHKAKALESINKRITAMTDHKSCVTAAKDKKALKACQAKMKDFRGEMKTMRKERQKGGKKSKAK